MGYEQLWVVIVAGLIRLVAIWVSGLMAIRVEREKRATESAVLSGKPGGRV